LIGFGLASDWLKKWQSLARFFESQSLGVEIQNQSKHEWPVPELPWASVSKRVFVQNLSYENEFA